MLQSPLVITSVRALDALGGDLRRIHRDIDDAIVPDGAARDVDDAALRLAQAPALLANGQLSNSGTIAISTGATLDLNGIGDTIGRLSGTRHANLAGATLTLSEGASPGSSPGTLLIDGFVDVIGSSDSAPAR